MIQVHIAYMKTNDELGNKTDIRSTNNKISNALLIRIGKQINNKKSLMQWDYSWLKKYYVLDDYKKTKLNQIYKLQQSKLQGKKSRINNWAMKAW